MMTKLDAKLLRLAGEGASPRMDAELTRIISSGGKRLRPSLAYLCYKIAGGNDESEPILPLMSMLELMHTASLVHDDVVDDAQVRRTAETINAAQGKAFAVQAGDFLLAKAMTLIHHYRGTGINEALADVSAEMCLGEFQQRRTAFDLGAQNERLYLLQIRRKTASLIAASCYCGALAGGMPEEKAAALRSFGERFGTAFQILDDLMDYTAADADSYAGKRSTGKAFGQDIRSGVFTLPVLLIKDTIPSEIRMILEMRNKTEEDVRLVIDYIKKTDALSLTRERISQLSAEALTTLSLFPLTDTSVKDALIQLANSMVHVSQL
jgi:geranylgeranyl pyrophosphate synthase